MLTKVCTKCNVEKTVDCFSKFKEGKYGVRSCCRLCVSSYMKSRYSENKDRLAEQNKKYYRDNKKTIYEKQKKYVAANKEATAIIKRRYKKAHPEKSAADVAKRSAMKIKATPSWANHEKINEVYSMAAEMTNNGVLHHVDHIIPLRSKLVCGLHCESNLQVLKASVNSSKGNRWWPDMW